MIPVRYAGAETDDGDAPLYAFTNRGSVTDTRAIDEVGLSVAQVEESIVTSPLPTMKTVLSSRQAIGNGGRCLRRTQRLRFYLWRRCHGSDSKFNLFNSSRIDAITSPKCATKRRANNADPQSDRLLMEYPDELLWECKDDALALSAATRRCSPILHSTCSTPRSG